MSKIDQASDKRPDPDALLALAGRDRRGKLTVFLGAAPGVGKTYAMLARARQARNEGIDVVIGLVETHGRTETAALLKGLEVLPRLEIDYRGHKLREFDIDAALARKPRLVIVDELAHTNPAEGRHPKRYQDVAELIDAGIDVWTALNIQHIESLSDVVASITGVTVQESVPDSVLSTADEVVVVDITPTELIKRLQDGKVYLPDNAARAAKGFFRPGNLTALRELALRRTADRVDDQMVDFLRQNAIEGPWASAERLLVCVSAGEHSPAVIRSAARLASGLNARWIALHAERPGYEDSSPEAVQQLAAALHLAERLGAETHRLTAKDLPRAILRFARSENVTQLVLGRSRAGWWRRLRGRSLPDEIIRQGMDIGIHIVTTDEAPEPPRRRRKWLAKPTYLGTAAIATLASVACAIGVGLSISEFVALPNLSMVFLTAVLFCALTYGVWAAIVAALLSFLAYNFFFIAPVNTLTIAEPHELFALMIFLIVAIFTGGLAGRVRDQAEATSQRVKTIRSLYEFSRKLSGTAKLDDVLWAASAHIHETVGGAVALLMPRDGDLALVMAWPPEDTLGTSEMTAARWAYEKAEPAGAGTGTLPNIRLQFRPLLTPRTTVGVCGMVLPPSGDVRAAETERALAAILNQTATAIDRALLVVETARADALEQSEKLRTALLSSISHDLRTPLATITGAVSSLRTFGPELGEASRSDLLQSIDEEAARLSRFVSNLLDMTRIEAGALDAMRDWVDIGDTIRTAVERARDAFPGRAIIISLAPDLPLVRGDSTLLGQVLFNLLDNAQKYGASSAGTVVFARKDKDWLVISVTDQGKGIAEADLERVFDKFQRVESADGRAAGTGLGLSICRGLVEAMGGTIHAESPAARRRGTRIVIRLPVATGAVPVEAIP